MADQTARANRAQSPQEPLSLERLTDATHVARQIVDRDGVAFLPILNRLEFELRAMRARLDLEGRE